MDRQPGHDPLYGAELAPLHHARFGDVARDAASLLVERLGQAGFEDGLVVDLAAGSGILSRHLVDAGYRVLGVDISASMLRIARRDVPEATFVQDSLWTADLPDPGEIVAVAAIGEAFSYATDDRSGPAGLRDLLSAIHRALRPGGLLLFDVAGPGRSGPGGSRERSFRCDETFLYLEETEDRSSGVLSRRITLFLPAGELYRRVEEIHRLYLLAPAKVKAMLADTGFEYERLSRYRDTDFPPGWTGFLGRKAEDR